MIDRLTSVRERLREAVVSVPDLFLTLGSLAAVEASLLMPWMTWTGVGDIGPYAALDPHPPVLFTRTSTLRIPDPVFDYSATGSMTSATRSDHLLSHLVSGLGWTIVIMTVAFSVAVIRSGLRRNDGARWTFRRVWAMIMTVLLLVPTPLILLYVLLDPALADIDENYVGADAPAHLSGLHPLGPGLAAIAAVLQVLVWLRRPGHDHGWVRYRCTCGTDR